MKFDVQLAAYLYENKTLRLEGIGTFTLDRKVSVPAEQEKEVYYPIEGLAFTYNPKSDTDEDVIVFLVQKLHKIQPLIRSDLESYLTNIKQFINLGKPYTIEGIGTLSKNNQGIYEFTPGTFLPVKEELSPHRDNVEHNYPVRSESSAGRIVAIVLIGAAALAAIGGIGWGILNLITNTKNRAEETVQQTTTDTLPKQSDPLTVPKTAAPVVVENVPITDLVNYKMVFEITRFKERAKKRTAQLNTYGNGSKYDTIIINDSIRYRLFLPMRIRPADTLRVKDSLSKFLGRRVTIRR